MKWRYLISQKHYVTRNETANLETNLYCEQDDVLYKFRKYSKYFKKPFHLLYSPVIEEWIINILIGYSGTRTT